AYFCKKHVKTVVYKIQIGFFIKNSYIKNILNREELINLNIYEKKFKKKKAFKLLEVNTINTINFTKVI
ncbi:hypothetical protein L1Y59_19725, partial [Acinetobacter baumannii]|nr:hypothetical protein [Acinetobacter baumannii]